MRKLSVILLTLAVLFSCYGPKALLPSISGKAGEVIVLMDKANWEGDLGTAVREALGGDCPWLAQREPLFNLVNVSPSGFSEMFQVHRNIIIFNIDPQTEKEGMTTRNDVWARGQCVIRITASGNASALALFNENAPRVSSTLEQAERDRNISNARKYEEASISAAVREAFGGSAYFPTGYKLRKRTDDFFWIESQKQSLNQGVFIYRYPADAKENFTVDALISHRNEILRNNVPGMFDNTWMTTATAIEPTVEFIRFRGRQFAQTRGFWEVHGDYMGGPFVSHAFYSKDGKDIIVLDAWVYAPKFDKRQYLRQVESVIYSFEWAEAKEKQAAE